LIDNYNLFIKKKLYFIDSYDSITEEEKQYIKKSINDKIEEWIEEFIEKKD